MLLRQNSGRVEIIPNNRLAHHADECVYGGRVVDAILGDDGLPADDVGEWAKEKHELLRRYLDISRATRKKFLGVGKAGATFIDLFAGAGRSRIRGTSQWIDGSAVAAWKIGSEGGAPFTQVWVGDIDEPRRSACVERLRRLRAPVNELLGDAVSATEVLVGKLNPHALHFAFLDPFSLGELDFRIVKALSTLKRIDILIHLSAMDLQRNLESNAAVATSALDRFAPDWRTHVSLSHSQAEIRRLLVDYWRCSITKLGVWPSTEMRLITGSKNQPLYWLLLAAKSPLAQKFWKIASNVEGQRALFDN
jgi:three-Cys-motif partner protein